MHLFYRNRGLFQDICLILSVIFVFEPAFVMMQPFMPALQFSSEAKAATVNNTFLTGLYSKPMALVVRHAPVFNSGLVDGSIWIYRGENFTLNGNTSITGDMVLPGTPVVDLSGNASVGQVIQGGGSALPDNYTVTLGGNFHIDNIYTHTDSSAMPGVPAPPLPAGTRDVHLTVKTETPGDFSTLRNLTLSGKAGKKTIPPGTYGTFTASDRCGFIMGIEGSRTPAIYNLQGLSVTGQATVDVVGPIILTIADGLTLSGKAGSNTDAFLCDLRLASGNIVIDGNSTFNGIMTAPRSELIINGNTDLIGFVQCDRVTVSGNGSFYSVVAENQAPLVNVGPDQTVKLPDFLTLTGVVQDDGLPLGGMLTVHWEEISGPSPVYFSNQNTAETTVTFTQEGTYVLRLSAFDTELTSYDEITVTVEPDISLPEAQDQWLTTNEDVPLSITLTATGGEIDPLIYSVTIPVKHGSLTGSAPNLLYTPETDFFGADSLCFEATDNINVSEAKVHITVNSVNDAPVVHAGADQLMALGQAVQLSGSYTDDGTPAPPNVQIQWTQVNGPASAVISTPGALVTNVSFTVSGVYTFRLGVNDSDLEGSDQVMITVNAPPVVSAGPDQTAGLPGNVFLNGSVSDDGIPSAGGLHSVWTQISGPGFVVIEDSTAAVTQVYLGMLGTYVFELSATDGMLESHDQVTIMAVPAGDNMPPQVLAGPDQVIGNTYSTTVSGQITDDGLPYNALVSHTWSKVSGPGVICIQDPDSMQTKVTFSKSGTYVLRLMANDTEMSGWDDIRVQIYTDNLPPVVDAGQDKSVSTTEVLLAGQVTDDGEPAGVLNTAWSRLQGPGLVQIQDSTLLITRAIFSKQGTYQVLLSANDGEWTVKDTVQIVVTGNRAPWVEAGADQFLEIESVETGSVTLPDPPDRSPNQWIYDIGQPGVNNIITQHGLDDMGNDVVALGLFSQAGGEESGFVARWDGCGWQTFYDALPVDPENPDSDPLGYLYKINNSRFAVNTSNDTVYIGGCFFTDVNRPPDGHSDWYARWLGDHWDPWHQFYLTYNFINLYDIDCSDHGVYIGGQFRFQAIDDLHTAFPRDTVAGYLESHSIARWNGTAWENLGKGISYINTYGTESDGIVQAVAGGPDGSVFAGGYFAMNTPYGVCNSIAWWDGDEWRPMGNGLTGGISWSGLAPPRVFDIIVDENGDVYASGNFTVAGNVSAKCIAKATWNAAAQTWEWSQVGPANVYGFNSVVLAMAFYDGDLYAGGDFRHNTQRTMNYISRFDGTDWQPIVSGSSIGVNEMVTALTATPDGLFIGGEFTQAGGQAVGRIAQWGRYRQPDLTGPDPVLVEASPPEGSSVTLEAEVSHYCGSPLTVTWNVDSGDPEAVIELDGTEKDVVQTVPFEFFYTPGVHVITVLVDDGRADPAFHATTVTVKAPAVAQLAGIVTDDGLPAGHTLQTGWTITSGPAAVDYSDQAAPGTEARFTEPGTYVLRLTADDSEYSRYDQVTIQVQEKGIANRPPEVLAGPDRSVTPGSTVTLSASVNDDGLPSGSVSLQWTKTGGPGSVTFTQPNSLSTGVSFSAGGSYVLRLTADDSEFTAYDELNVQVSTVVNAPPVVAAGSDATIAINQDALLDATASDDGLPIGLLDVSWEQLSGPGLAVISQVNGNTIARFTNPGLYTLRVTATDGLAYATDDVTINVLDAALPGVVALDLPIDGSEITSPVPVVGTVSGLTMGSYTLSLKRKNESAWSVFRTGTQPVLDGELGTLDPTLLRNGMYDIRLDVTDALGYTYADSAAFVVRGGMKVGNFTVSFVDMNVPVSGIPIQIIRTYDSRDRNRSMDFGYGWSLDIRSVEVEESVPPYLFWQSAKFASGYMPYYCIRETRPHVVTVTASDGSVHIFDMGFGQTQWAAAPPPTPMTVQFTPRPGTYSTLTPVGDTQLILSSTWNLNEWNPLQITGASGLFDPDAYVLTLKDGRKLTIDEIDGLEFLEDRNDNTLEITDNGIVHSSGKSISFTRNTQGRITSITDPMNHSVDFTYNAAGDLTAVTDQEEYTTTFTYNTDHFCTDITDPRGIRAARQLYDDDGRMIAMVDAEGDTIHLVHNLGTRQEVIRDRLGRVTIYEYDDQGNVISKTDAEGNVWSYTYDSNGNKLTEKDPDNNVRKWTYDASGNMLSETDPLNNTTKYTYNANGQLLTKTDPMNNTWIYTYDVDGNRLTETDPGGHTFTYVYDTQGNEISKTDSSDNATLREYDTSGNMTKLTDALGHETDYTYDANGNQLSQTTTRTTPSGIVTMTMSKAYDNRGNVTSVTDADGKTAYTEYSAIGKKSADIDKLGRRTEYVYDDRGNETDKVFPDATRETTTYDANGNRISTTDREGRVTTYEYDTNIDRISKVTFPTTGFINIDTDETGSYTAIADDKGNVNRYVYDSDGNLKATINALGDSTTYLYDYSGNQIAMTDARGNTTEYEYDGLKRKTKTIFPDGTYILTAYDHNKNKISEKDQAGKITRFEYDALGRLTKVIDAQNHETSYTYDELGNQLTQTDALNHTTRWEYDNLGRVTKRILPLGQEETFTYDAVGNVLTKTDFNDNTISYEYNSNNKLVLKTYPGYSTENYTWTAIGRQDTVIDARGTTINVFDTGNRLTRTINPDGSSIQYRYDTMGNRTAVITGSDTTKYTFDKMNRLKTVTDPDGGMTTYNYDKNGNRANVIYPNGTVAEYTYDSLNRLTKLFNRTSDGDTISCYVYLLGLSGNRIKVTEHNGRTVDYTYDDTYKLTGEIIHDPVFGNRTISYTYDAVGNRLTKTENGVVTSYTCDNNDRLLSETSPQSTISYQYDNNGNTLSKTSASENTSYTYDYNNRLMQVNNGTDVITYTYDTDGMRVRKSVNGNEINYLLDKNRDYSQVLKEYNGSGQTIADYTYGDDLISQKRGSLTSFYHYDGQLSTRQLTDASGQVTDTYTYDAFGLLLQRTGSTQNDYLYTGEQYDPNVGFYYLRARYYNPSIGRFLTMDTWPGMQFEPGSLHKYLYCENWPVGSWDPSGNMTLLEIVTTSSIKAWLYTALTAIAISGTAWLFSITKSPVDWDGLMVVISLPFSSIMFTFYYLHGIQEFDNKPPETGDAGGIAVLYYDRTLPILYQNNLINVALQFTETAITPGIFGPSAWVFSGIVVGITGAITVPLWAEKLIGVGGAGTAALWGFGVWLSFGWAVGREGSINLARGVSISGPVQGSIGF